MFLDAWRAYAYTYACFRWAILLVIYLATIKPLLVCFYSCKAVVQTVLHSSLEMTNANIHLLEDYFHVFPSVYFLLGNKFAIAIYG